MKHLHKLERFKTKKGAALYKCMIPGCSSFFSFPLSLLGVKIACLICDQETVVTKDLLKLKKLICDGCRMDRATRRQSA